MQKIYCLNVKDNITFGLINRGKKFIIEFFGMEVLKQNYIEDLKSVSGYLGYSPEDIDMLIAEGYDLEEIEEYIYCCAGGEI